LPFCLVYRFLCHLLALQFFLLLDDLLELFFVLGSSTMLNLSWIPNSNFVLLCCRCTHSGGEIEKPKWSVPWFDCDE
jgi:hypothetical protein